jgi:DNA-binding phage protein
MELIAERAGSTRSTLYRIEKGDPNVRVGSYLMVMQALGILNGFADVEDALGNRLIRESLPKRARPIG